MNPADIDTLVPVAAEEVQLEEPAAPLVKLDAALTQGPSWLELATGVEGSTRRLLSFYILSFIVATAARQACFSTHLFGSYLIKELGPVERESVRWGWILVVRAFDLVLGSWIWKRVEGVAKKDGALFGVLLAAVSRASLYTFEHSYFLLKTETVYTVFLIDLIALGSAFSLLPVLLPHSIDSRPAFSAWKRLHQNPELLVNLALALGLATLVGATGAYIIERIGGQAFVKANTFDLEVPAVYAADTMTTAQMMAHPTVSVPALRSFLKPLSMPRHLLHSFGIALASIPFVTILPSLSPLGIALTVFALVFPATSFLFWDVLPVTAVGAIGTGAFLALRASAMAGLSAWVLEELREMRRIRAVEIVVVEEGDGEVDVVAVIEAEVEIADEALRQRRGVLKKGGKRAALEEGEEE